MQQQPSETTTASTKKPVGNPNFLATVLVSLFAILLIIFFATSDLSISEVEVQTPKKSPFEIAKENNQKQRSFIFELDQPRFADEAEFYHLPKSQNGVLNKPEDNPEYPTASEQARQMATDLYEIFSLYDKDEKSDKSLPFYGTMCVGGDCQYIPNMVHSLHTGIGHFIVVVNTEDEKWVQFFSLLQKFFPGRFTKFHRPQKLSCAESWNLVTRTAMTQRPQPDQVFIANADWAVAGENNLQRFAEWSRTKLHLVASRYYHFSSFAFTKKGYLELGYFDEVIYPALAEDVEFHVKAVSKGMGELGLYDRWSEGSHHVNRASAGDGKINERNGRVARFDYIWRKWNVKVPNHRDFMSSSPFKHPWNNPHIKHNNSWVVDKRHRRCANTGEGKLLTTGRCYYDPMVLQAVMPPGIKFIPSPAQSTLHDQFPGGYH